MADAQPTMTAVFSYGSNGVTQMRERCQNDTLTAVAAYLPGYRRIFAGLSRKWDGGGIDCPLLPPNLT